jgi:hypothetical protein
LKSYGTGALILSVSLLSKDLSLAKPYPVSVASPLYFDKSVDHNHQISIKNGEYNQ